MRAYGATVRDTYTCVNICTYKERERVKGNTECGSEREEVMEVGRVERVKGEMEDLWYLNKLRAVHRLIIFKN